MKETQATEGWELETEVRAGVDFAERRRSTHEALTRWTGRVLPFLAGVTAVIGHPALIVLLIVTSVVFFASGLRALVAAPAGRKPEAELRSLRVRAGHGRLEVSDAASGKLVTSGVALCSYVDGDGRLVVRLAQERQRTAYGDLIISDLDDAQREQLRQATRSHDSGRALRLAVESHADARGWMVAVVLAYLWGWPIAFMLLMGGAVALMGLFDPTGQLLPLLLIAAGCFAVGGAASWGVSWLRRMMLRQHAVVGTDGVAVEGFGRGEFIPHEKIRGLRETPRGIIVEHEEGELALFGGQCTDAIAQRIRRSRDLEAELAAPRYRVAELEAETSAERWARGFTEASATQSAYRETVLDDEALVRVAADPGQPVERRVGAAVAAAQSPRVRTRLRVAADATADAELRGALDAALEGEVDARRVARVQRRAQKA